ncbi:MAG: D-alanyl-D-alanine carboxypeptidase/D-alanyl-D-alanine-endopeptidase [Calditrichaeota bacterium]|nr:D-alanyl-D-alanine carboxypeptidase/D-alanyl-D-alanine-endopeptidase [Calditrichota bacterium]MCB9368040.1 D-alanyl-D-alanine carboxypeptidase/D-alanyl-D-alanine-endopeptidase [Calditrichota bacterium]
MCARFIREVKVISLFSPHGLFGIVLVLLSIVPAIAADVPRGVDSLLRQDPLIGTSWSILFADATSGQTILDVDSDRLLTPASLTKLWTTSTAFSYLGADFKFETRVTAASRPDSKGTISGDLQIHCDGDPMFELKLRRGHRRTAQDEIAEELYGQGIREITGNLTVDVSGYKRTCGNGVWEMGDLREGFAPAVDGVGFNSNVCNVEIAPGAHEGDSAVVTFDPSYAPITVENLVLTASRGNDSWIEYSVTPCRDELEISGLMAQGDSPQYIWFPIQEPAVYFGLAIKEALSRHGIRVAGDVSVSRSESPLPATLYVHESPPLAEIAAIVNKDSDNYLAEYLLSKVGQKMYGHGSTESGLRAVQRFARERGIQRSQFSLEDGCGLSRQNIVSAHAIVRLLSYMSTTENADAFEATLSQSGVDGTISNRLSTEGMLGRVRAKTGTMTNVSGLAGYIGLDDGRKIAFAILSNNFRCSRNYVRNTQDNIVREVYRAIN